MSENNNKKYEFTGETKCSFGAKLHRIRRLSDGLVGGFIEKDDNLSQEGNCFVYESARVYGQALVCGSARVYGQARVCGQALVCGSARVYGQALIYGSAQVFEQARVYGQARIYESARICGEARVYGQALIYGSARVCGSAQVSRNAISITLPNHAVTITDNNITIGCECHSIDYWRENSEEIGKEHNYTPEMIRLYKEVILAIVNNLPKTNN
jgi:carbonic anhydrase/acetyltransferase-like protein (isoleucine patch superfamily)